jgi:hypothetical protein
MKTLKIAMIATLVAFAMVSMANADGFTVKPANKIVNLTLEQAFGVPGLVAAMYQQLNSSFLEVELPSYTVKVEHAGVIYRITGTRAQWIVFIRLKWKYANDIKYLEIDEE